MAYSKGTKSQEDFKSEELANLGSIRDGEYARLFVRVVKLSWKGRDGQMVQEQEPRVDVREYKITGKWQGWSKGLSMKVEDYRRLKALIPSIDLALKHQGIEV